MVKLELREVVDLNFDAERFRSRTDDFDRFGMTVVGDEKSFSIRNGRVTKRHCFGRARCFVEHRRVRDLELGEIGDHRLKIQKRFEPALCELGLVWRVSGVPTGIFQNVSLNNRRRDGIGITSADKIFCDFVFLRNRSQLGQRLGFRFRFRQT